MVERTIGDKRLRMVRGDITEVEVDAFVFDITEDAKLGSGFGGAIQQRGGIEVRVLFHDHQVPIGPGDRRLEKLAGLDADPGRVALLEGGLADHDQRVVVHHVGHLQLGQHQVASVW